MALWSLIAAYLACGIAITLAILGHALRGIDCQRLGELFDVDRRMFYEEAAA